MATWGFGLRAKAMLALALACLLAMVPTGLLGWKALDRVRDHFGETHARNLTLLKRDSIIAPVSRELALSRRLAGSVLARQWLQEEDNAARRALFFEEAEGYRKDFGNHAYFLISARSRHYYANDDSKPFSPEPRYTLEAARPDDAWFFNTLRQSDPYNLNVNSDAHLNVTRVWLNVGVYDGTRKIGIAGTGLDLSAFLKAFVSGGEPGVTPMILNRNGAIQAHRDRALIATNQAGRQAATSQTLQGHLPPAERAALSRGLQQAMAHPGEVSSLHATLDGKPQWLALSYIPELKWFIVTAVDVQAAQVINRNWLYLALGALVMLAGVLLVAFAWAVEKLVLKPLHTLKDSASALADGQFDVALPPPGRDELGDLSRAFGIMAEQIRNNTLELESKVQARTRALEEANRDIQRAHQQINDSIDYASLIQRAILPDQKLKQLLGPHHFVLWRPRDVVGGDFYVFRAEAERYLAGVVDCAGHGVPGALMTMLARSALEIAMNQAGIDSPAAVLTHTDQTMRAMLQQCELPRAIATNMDIGLARADRATGTLRYAGAKISLYWSDGDEVGEIKGGRRAIGDRRQGRYEDTEIVMRPGLTYYLATDGFLDQAGGELGYGFGNTRFADLLRQHARLPMEQQARALDQALEAYKGDYPQRDDITILSFRFD